MLFGWLFSHCVWLDAYINLNFKKMTSQDRYFEHVIGTVTSSGPVVLVAGTCLSSYLELFDCKSTGSSS